MEVPRLDNVSSLCINFVNIILCGSDENVLDAVIQSVNEWLRENLLEGALVVARKFGCPKLTELSTSDN